MDVPHSQYVANLLRHRRALGLTPKRGKRHLPKQEHPTLIAGEYARVILAMSMERLRAALAPLLRDLPHLLDASPLRRDADWDEGQHPRGADGKFGIADAEHDVKDLPHERLHAFDNQGRHLFSQNGEEKETFLTAEQHRLIRDATVLHNHPGGTPLSLGDVLHAARHNVAETRVVAHNGAEHAASSIRRPAGGWPSENAIRDAYQAATVVVQENMRERGLNSQFPSARAARRYLTEKTWETASKALGLEYSESPISRRRTDADFDDAHPRDAAGKFTSAGTLAIAVEAFPGHHSHEVVERSWEHEGAMHHSVHVTGRRGQGPPRQLGGSGGGRDLQEAHSSAQTVLGMSLGRTKARRKAKTDDIRLDAHGPEHVRKTMDAIRRAIHIPEQRIVSESTRFGHRTVDFQKHQLQGQVNAAFGMQVPIVDHALQPRLEAFAHENVALIQDIGQKASRDVEGEVMRAFTAGDRWERLAPRIQDRLGVGEERARVIARDQIGKLNGQINVDRQRALGIRKFIWRTVNDNRVRDEHEDLQAESEETPFDFDDPPDEGMPGEPVQCRCYAEPVVVFSDGDYKELDGGGREDAGDWDEAKHPRAADGKFGEGAGERLSRAAAIARLGEMDAQRPGPGDHQFHEEKSALHRLVAEHPETPAEHAGAHETMAAIHERAAAEARTAAEKRAVERAHADEQVAAGTVLRPSSEHADAYLAAADRHASAMTAAHARVEAEQAAAAMAVSRLQRLAEIGGVELAQTAVPHADWVETSNNLGDIAGHLRDAAAGREPRDRDGDAERSAYPEHREVEMGERAAREQLLRDGPHVLSQLETLHGSQREALKVAVEANRAKLDVLYRRAVKEGEQHHGGDEDENEAKLLETAVGRSYKEMQQRQLDEEEDIVGVGGDAKAMYARHAEEEAAHPGRDAALAATFLIKDDEEKRERLHVPPDDYGRQDLRDAADATKVLIDNLKDDLSAAKKQHRELERTDADWDEGQHQRGADGKFGTGSGPARARETIRKEVAGAEARHAAGLVPRGDPTFHENYARLQRELAAHPETPPDMRAGHEGIARSHEAEVAKTNAVRARVAEQERRVSDAAARLLATGDISPPPSEKLAAYAAAAREHAGKLGAAHVDMEARQAAAAQTVAHLAHLAETSGDELPRPQDEWVGASQTLRDAAHQLRAIGDNADARTLPDMTDYRAAHAEHAGSAQSARDEFLRRTPAALTELEALHASQRSATTAADGLGRIADLHRRAVAEADHADDADEPRNVSAALRASYDRLPASADRERDEHPYAEAAEAARHVNVAESTRREDLSPPDRGDLRAALWEAANATRSVIRELRDARSRIGDALEDRD